MRPPLAKPKNLPNTSEPRQQNENDQALQSAKQKLEECLLASFPGLLGTPEHGLRDLKALWFGEGGKRPETRDT